MKSWRIYIEYFMESVCVRYLRTSWSSIGNRMSERSERVRFLIQTNECVNIVRIHFPWCIIFIIYILWFKFLFNDKLCCTDSGQKLIKDVSLSYINVLTVDIFSIQTVCRWRYSKRFFVSIIFNWEKSIREARGVQCIEGETGPLTASNPSTTLNDKNMPNT